MWRRCWLHIVYVGYFDCFCVCGCACFVGAGGYKRFFFQCERDHIPSMQKSIFIVQVLVFHSCVGGGGGGGGGGGDG